MATVKRRKRLSSADKNRLLIVFVALLAAAFLGLRYPTQLGKLTEQRTQVQALERRIETRAQPLDAPTQSAPLLERQLTELEEQYIATKERLRLFRGGFATLDRTDELQSLWLEVSSLARDHELNVESMQGFGSVAQDGVPVTSVDVLRQEANNRFRRPLVNLKAAGSYWQVTRFLRDLGTLSHNVVVVRLSLSATPLGEQAAGSVDVAQPLAINLLLAM